MDVTIFMMYGDDDIRYMGYEVSLAALVIAQLSVLRVSGKAKTHSGLGQHRLHFFDIRNAHSSGHPESLFLSMGVR